jgi:predicted ester cyclase
VSAETNRQAIELAMGRWNAHDDSYFSLYADDAVCNDQPPGLPPTLDGLKALFHQMWASFPDVQVRALHVVAEGDLVAVHLHVSGTHQGEFMGAAPTGNTIELRTMAFVRFGPEGKVVERWTRLDEVGLMTQLGLMPAPTAA